MRNKTAFWLITIILLIVAIYVIVVVVAMPVINKNPLPKVSINKSVVKEKTEKGDDKKAKDQKNQNEEAKTQPLVSGDSKQALARLFEIRKRENLLDSRLDLANEDSMYMVLDFVRNAAFIEMKGVELHECKLIRSEISNSIKLYHNEDILNWMAEPFNVKHIDATIPKLIFIEKIAPKDTIEANRIQQEPKATKLDDVFIVMDFDRNLRLVIQQDELPDEAGKKIIGDLQWKYQDSEINKSIQSLTKLNRQPVMPQIKIVLSKSDATILYRALPVHLKMILRF